MPSAGRSESRHGCWAGNAFESPSVSKLPTEWRRVGRRSGRYHPAPYRPGRVVLQLWQPEKQVGELFAEIRRYKQPFRASYASNSTSGAVLAIAMCHGKSVARSALPHAPRGSAIIVLGPEGE